jgi:hypothetical protein
VRTIRDAIGFRTITLAQVQQVIDYYNTTYHKGIDCTPHEMMMNTELEWQYIRHCQEKLRQVNQFYESRNLLGYRRGNVIVVHLDYSKTSRKFEKQRRHWNQLGVFVAYEHGNVKCVVINQGVRAICVPVYYTRKIAEDIDHVSTAAINTYVLSTAQIRMLSNGWARFINQHDIIHNP